MKAKNLISFALLLLIGGAAHGAEQGAGLRGPILGYVMDDTNAGIRPILGIPGAATIGDIIETTRDIERAAISVNADYAIAVAKENHDVFVVRRLSESPICTSIDGVRAAPDRIIISGHGSAAALMYGEQSIAVVRGLPDEPHVDHQVDLSDLNGRAAAVAVSDSGAVLAAIADGFSTIVYFVGSSGAPQAVMTADTVSALAFSPEGESALVADAQRNEVVFVPFVSQPAPALFTWTEADGLAGPLAIATRDRDHVLVANANGNVIDFSIRGGAATVVACECQPLKIEALRDNSVFLLNGFSEGPLTLFQISHGNARVLRVPPPRHTSSF